MRRNVILVLLLLLVTAGAVAQPAPATWEPRTGDAWTDRALADINQYGNRYGDAFVDELTRYLGAPRALVTQLLVQQHWAPGDVYYACALAQTAGQPCRAVADRWSRDHEQGWGVIMQGLGITTDSPQFERLKHGVADSYQRWGRPLPAAELQEVKQPSRASATPPREPTNPSRPSKPSKPA
jgi:hypothetical protein